MQNDAAAVFVVPEFTRFAGFGINNQGNPIATPPAGVTASEVQPASGGTEQILLFLGKMTGHQTKNVSVTVQAQWVDPTEVPNHKISTINYAAAFLVSTSVASFKSPSAIDYIQYIESASNAVASTSNDAGDVDVTIAGSTACSTRIDQGDRGRRWRAR